MANMQRLRDRSRFTGLCNYASAHDSAVHRRSFDLISFLKDCSNIITPWGVALQEQKINTTSKFKTNSGISQKDTTL
jgi:hypothetical protein